MDRGETTFCETSIELDKKPSDYYEAINPHDDFIQYRANRAALRDLANSQMEVISQVARLGGNTHTANLDILDQVDIFFANEPIDAKTQIYAVLDQEMDAILSKAEEDLAKSELDNALAQADLADAEAAATAATSADAAVIGNCVAVVVVILGLLFIFS